jgi:hypothetical protein
LMTLYNRRYAARQYADTPLRLPRADTFPPTPIRFP